MPSTNQIREIQLKKQTQDCFQFQTTPGSNTNPTWDGTSSTVCVFSYMVSSQALTFAVDVIFTSFLNIEGLAKMKTIPPPWPSYYSTRFWQNVSLCISVTYTSFMCLLICNRWTKQLYHREWHLVLNERENTTPNCHAKGLFRPSPIKQRAVKTISKTIWNTIIAEFPMYKSHSPCAAWSFAFWLHSTSVRRKRRKCRSQGFSSVLLSSKSVCHRLRLSRRGTRPNFMNFILTHPWTHACEKTNSNRFMQDICDACWHCYETARAHFAEAPVIILVCAAFPFLRFGLIRIFNVTSQTDQHFSC